jgi:hypothetical protein
MAPTALAGRRHSQGVPRPAMARLPGEPRVSRSRPEGMRRREHQPIHGPDSLGRSEAQPRCASTCDGSPSGRASRKPKQARRDAPARTPAHPWPRQPWAVAANAKGSPDGRAAAPPGGRGRLTAACGPRAHGERGGVPPGVPRLPPGAFCGQRAKKPRVETRGLRDRKPPRHPCRTTARLRPRTTPGASPPVVNLTRGRRA